MALGSCLWNFLGMMKPPREMCWTYLWILWIVFLIFMSYLLRGPLAEPFRENVILVTAFLNNLTPKFYVALTGTSSLISGLILIFEWWYFRKYGTSFIEQVSLNHISPLIGGGSGDNNNNNNSSGSAAGANGASASVLGAPLDANGAATGGNVVHQTTSVTSEAMMGMGLRGMPPSSIAECKVWRNPLNLFRGAEYQRLYWANGKEPLTYYDMNLSAQDHQTFFTCTADEGHEDYEIMQRAWRERSPESRIKLAREALEKNPENASAMLLLSEEECTTIAEVEKMLKSALKCADSVHRKSLQQLQQFSGNAAAGTPQESQHRRDTNVVIYLKRRLAMCYRRLGKLKESVKIMRDLIKDFPVNVFNIHENLIEALLEMQAYADVQAVLAKYDDISLPKSATICYTAALLKARQVSDKFCPDVASKRGLSTSEMNAVEAIHRAVEFNPHVPKYLLEMKSLIFPPEHILKRGDSEAISYSFFHLAHWKKVDGALNLLHCTWEGTFRIIPAPLEKGHLFYPYPPCTESADRELLPIFHDLSVYPQKELPFFILFTAGLCSCTALLAMLTHQFPEPMGFVAKTILSWMFSPIAYIFERVEDVFVNNLLQQLSRV